MNAPGIFFEGIDIYGLEGADSYWNVTVRDICSALSAGGVPCEPLRLHDRENTTLSFDPSALPPFAISWNFNNGRWAMYQGRQVRMTSVLPVRNIVLLWDHPVHWAETIQETQEFDQQFGRPPFFIGVMDSGHMDFLIDMGVGRDQIFRWRQAGPPAPENVPDMTERSVDFAFHGTINDVEEFEKFCTRNEISDPVVMVGLQKAIAAIIEEPVDVYAAVVEHIAQPGVFDAAPMAIAPLCRELDRLTRDIRRVALLGGLRDLNIHYIGKVDGAFQATNPNSVFHGAMPFNEIEAYLRNTKVVFYDTINFRDAAVMRLFYSIQQGCAPAAEMNAYLRNAFTDGENILALTLADPASNSARLRDMVANPAALSAIAAAAQYECGVHHTWAQRIKPLIDAVHASV